MLTNEQLADSIAKFGGYWHGGQWIARPAASATPSASESDSAQFGIAPAGPTPEENDLAQFGLGPDAGAGGMDDYGNTVMTQSSTSQPQSMAAMAGGGGYTGNLGTTTNSYGLQSQPLGGGAGPVNYGGGGGGGGSSGGGMTFTSSTPFQDSRFGGGGGQSASQINSAAHQAAMSGGGGLGSTSSSVGTPIPGGSTTTTVGANPDVSQMAQPYLGGPPDPSKATPSAGVMPSKMYDMYTNFVQDPSSMESNPMYKSMMDAGLQASQRAMAARGFSGSGNMLTELQDRGMGIAGQFLPQMSSLYQGGAQTEANRWGMENQANLQAAGQGLDTWRAGAADQLLRASANYGANQDLNAQAQAMHERAKTMNELRLGYM